VERLAGALLESVHFRVAKPSIAVLLGPRGVGKTFLALEQQKRRGFGMTGSSARRRFPLLTLSWISNKRFFSRKCLL